MNEGNRKQKIQHVHVEQNVLSFQPAYKPLKLGPVHQKACVL